MTVSVDGRVSDHVGPSGLREALSLGANVTLVNRCLMGVSVSLGNDLVLDRAMEIDAVDVGVGDKMLSVAASVALPNECDCDGAERLRLNDTETLALYVAERHVRVR